MTSNLISMGLTSLSAMRLAMTITQQMGVQISTKDILSDPTLRSVAAKISDGKNATDGKDDAATEPATEATTDSGSKKKKPEPTNLGDPSYTITPMTLDEPISLSLDENEMWVGSFTAPRKARA